MNIEIPADVAHRAAQLSQRADSLRAQAADLPELLGRTYRRRAAELDLQAWALEVRAGGQIPVAA
jgi:hypothetical protein